MKRISIALAAITVAVALSSCSQSGSDPSASELQVTRVDVASRDDVCRNQAVVLEFSSDVNPAMVNENTIRITPEPLFESPVPGKFWVTKNRVVFQPALIPGDDDEDGTLGAAGFRENTLYRIDVLGELRVTSVESLMGASIIRDFGTTFRTTRRFLADSVPPQMLPASRDVRSLSDIVIRFSEPMDPRSFMDGDAFSVRLAGAPLPGTLRFDRTLSELRFIPEHDDPQSGAYGVLVSDRLTDLGGNGLANPTTFTVNVSPSSDSFLSEPVHLPQVTVRPLPPPLHDEGDRALFGREGVHAMAIYGPEDVGVSNRCIIYGIYLATTDPVERSEIFSSLEIAMWTTNADGMDLESELRKNLPTNGRTIVRRDDFFMVAPRDGNVLPIRFDHPFVYDGKSKIVVEIQHSGGSGIVHAGLIATGGQRRRVIASLRESVGVTDANNWDVTFGWPHSEGEVLTDWHTVPTLEPRFGKQWSIASSSLSYPEDFLLVEFEGARQLDRSGRTIGGTGGFTTDTSRLDGCHFVRARVTPLAELPSNAEVVLDSLLLPPR